MPKQNLRTCFKSPSWTFKTQHLRGQSPLGVAKTCAFSKLRFSGAVIHDRKSLSKAGPVSLGPLLKQALNFSSFLMLTGLMLAAPALANPGPLPKDYSSSHWAAEATRKAFDYGIFTGYPDGTFRGERPLTHYEAATVAGRLFDKLAQEHITTQYVAKKDMEVAENKYATLVAQGKLDADGLKAQVSSLQDELEDLKKQKRNMMKEMEKRMKKMQASAMPGMPAAMTGKPAAPAPRAEARPAPAPAPEEDEMDLSHHRTKPNKTVAMSPKEMQPVKGASAKGPQPGKGPKASRLLLGAGVYAPQGGDADAGFTWAVNYLFRPTSARSLMLGYNRADGLGVGTGAEADFSQASLTYLLKTPSAKSRLGYGVGVDLATVNFSTAAVEADESDLGWHVLLNYRLTPRFLAEMRVNGGGTDLGTGAVSTGGNGVSLRLLTGAGM